MRDRSFSTSTRPRSQQLRTHSAASESARLEVARQFEPQQIDLDNLAQAIRSLLAEGSPANPPHPDLLSSRHRGSHVVGANDAS